MQPFLKLAKIWPWLPHFRVVAEYESLSRASRRFGISGAALSKAIRTLERALELELFERGAGKLRLNDNGHTLLAAVRDDMRHLDDTITAMRSAGDAQLLRIALDSAWASLVLPVSGGAIELHELPSDPARALMRGDVDVVVHTAPLDHTGVVASQLALLERGVFVASSSADTGEHGVVAIRDSGDGWPGNRERAVALVVTSLAQVIAAVAAGAFAGALPVALGTRYGLRQVARAPALTPCTLWASTRRGASGSSTPAGRWCERVRGMLNT